jgi:hypothetical protein
MRKPLEPEVKKFIDKLLKDGYGVTVYFDRKGYAYDARTNESGRYQEIGCN